MEWNTYRRRTSLGASVIDRWSEEVSRVSRHILIRSINRAVDLRVIDDGTSGTTPVAATHCDASSTALRLQYFQRTCNSCMQYPDTILYS